MEALSLLLHGFSVLLTWKLLALMVLGLVLGIFVGVLPGLGGPNGVAILLPLTFTMDPTSAIVMLSCIYWGALFGGAITSILFNIPGEAWSVATTFDGYPMAQQGKAAEALTAAFTSSCQICMVSRADWPTAARPPVSDIEKPIVTGSPDGVAAPAGATARAAVTAPAAKRPLNARCTKDFIVSLPNSVALPETDTLHNLSQGCVWSVYGGFGANSTDAGTSGRAGVWRPRQHYSFVKVAKHVEEGSRFIAHARKGRRAAARGLCKFRISNSGSRRAIVAAVADCASGHFAHFVEVGFGALGQAGDDVQEPAFHPAVFHIPQRPQDFDVHGAHLE